MSVFSRSRITVPELLLSLGVVLSLLTLFAPVFGRAGSSDATVCIWNLSQIARAIQLYAADNDALLPPTEHDPAAIAYFSLGGTDCGVAEQANPYLRWPVVLEPYVARAAWTCPRARLSDTAQFIIPSDCDWLEYLADNAGSWGQDTDYPLCPRPTWPSGWGGEVTDTLAQGRLAGGSAASRAAASSRGGDDSRERNLPAIGVDQPIPQPDAVSIDSRPDRRAEPSRTSAKTALDRAARLGGKSRRLPAPPQPFRQSLGCNRESAGLDLRAVWNPGSYVICADTGAIGDAFGAGNLAYPDICALECANEECGWADWVNCASWAAACGLYTYAPMDGSFLRQGRPGTGTSGLDRRAPYARHHGGVNLGFLDGHTAWANSEYLLDQSPTWGGLSGGSFSGYSFWAPTSDCGFSDYYPGVPTLR